MPTGYTAGVADGTVTTLRQFALLCARGMGATILMRDEPMDAPIPERFEPSNYHQKNLDEALGRMKALKAMTDEEIAVAAADWNTKNEEYRLKRVQDNDVQRDRYDRLIAQTEAWEGAPDGLKKFMLDQLRQSREFDTHDDPLRHVPKPRTPAEWWAEECRSVTWNVQYHAKAHTEEIERTNERNGWLRQLHEALDAIDGGSDAA